jgi:hypothetical protein
MLEASMLSKCANPACTTPFHYLRDGKLFQIDTSLGGPQMVGPLLADEPRQPQRIEFFWLCAECSSTMTLAFQRGKGVVMVPLPAAAPRQAAAS